jgi:hypothetical protein
MAYYTDDEELDNKRLDEILDASEISADDVYDVPPRVIWVDNVTVGTTGNFSASVGKAKSKKTFNMIIMVASAISERQIIHYRVCLPEGKKKVLYIDTEQSRYHCHLVVKRILRMAGIAKNATCNKLKFVGLREESPSRRLKLIERALERCDEYGLVIIDGIRDLMLDINNATESVQVINKLMRWSSYYNLHIHCVLHLNKSDDNIRGHVGTELSNKAETVMLICKSKTDSSVSEVYPMQVRDQEFEPFAFGINDSGIPVDVPDYQIAGNAPRKTKRAVSDLTEQEHMEAITFAFKEPNISGYEKMINLLKAGYESIGYKRHRTTIANLLTSHIQKHRIINKDGYNYSLPTKKNK